MATYMKKSIAVINGPNINITGKREKKYYGSETWDEIQRKLEKLGIKLDCRLLFFQSNVEGEIINFIQQYGDEIDGVLINPASLSGYGYGVLDALMAIGVPYVEVHMSNIFAREKWHQRSIFVGNAVGRVIGFRGYSYELGLMALNETINEKRKGDLYEEK